jgi:hypothetical protein
MLAAMFFASMQATFFSREVFHPAGAGLGR